jgi:very-short-patch-repair endonuclease
VDALAKLQLRQDRIVTSAQLRALGFTEDAVRWQLRKGRWQRVLPKVVATFSGVLSRKQQIIAAALFGGPQTQIAGLTALELHGFKYAPRDLRVHVLVPHSASRAVSRKVRVVRTTRLDPAAWANGILVVCSPARAVVDALRGNTDPRVVRAVVAEAVQNAHTTIEQIGHELGRSVRNGTAILRDVVGEVTDGVRSAPEAELRALALRSRILPRFRWNPRLTTSDGVKLPTPDGYLEDVGIAVEVDSREFHLGADEWQRTLAHDNGLSAAGIVVLRFTPAEIRSEPNRVLGEIEQAYVRRLQGGLRPQVVVS